MAFETGPYLQVAAFCEQVIEDKTGVLSLIRVVDRFQVIARGPDAPEEMPKSNMNLTLVICLKSGSAKGSHPIKIVPELPSGINLEPNILSAYFEGGTRGQNFISRMNMPLEMPGIYWFKIYIGDQLLTKVPFEVIYSRTVTPQIGKMN